MPGAGQPPPPSPGLAVSLAQGAACPDLLIWREIAHRRIVRIADVARATRRPLCGEIYAALAMRGLARRVRGAARRKLRELCSEGSASHAARCNLRGATYVAQAKPEAPKGARWARPLRARTAHGAPARRPPGARPRQARPAHGAKRFFFVLKTIYI